MKKKLFFFVFILICSLSNAQDLSYGFLVGANAYDGEVKGEGIFGGDSYSSFGKEGWPLSIGGFINKKVSQSLGVKLNTFYKGNYRSVTFQLIGESYNAYISSIQNQVLLVFDVNKDYGKGFYLVAGPGIDFKLNERQLNSELFLSEDVFNNTLLDAFLGFGFTFSEKFGFELMGNYGLNSSLKSSDHSTSRAGAYLNLYFNIEPFFRCIYDK